MLNKILALGMIVSMANLISAEPVFFDKWDFEGQRLVSRIIQSQNFPDQTTIAKLKSKLPTLYGGAVTIYDRLIGAWSTGVEVSDYVPEWLNKLAENIYSALIQP